jgi:Outer membrane protein beta-barrel family
MKQKMALIALLLAGLISNAQSPQAKIGGMVTDSASGIVLEEASISLLKTPTNEIKQQLRNGKTGFIIRVAAPGQYIVTISHEGYITDTIFLNVSAADTTLHSLRIRLRLFSQELMQVVVHSRIPPMIVRNDTIAFNAGAFATRPNATLEDLLRKMPGFEIDQDGNLKLQGQPVDKIYLNGKEFFLSDIKTGTENLPADIIAEIQAFDSQTQKSKLTGIKERTGGKSINIKLKNNSTQGYLGNIYAATGNQNSYSLGGMVTGLGTQRLLLAAFNTNNINNQFTGTDNKNGPGSGGIQSLTNLSFNYRDNWGSRINATFNCGHYKSKISSTQNITRETFFADSSLLENRLANSVNEVNTYFLTSYIEFKIDSMNMLVYQTNLSPQKISRLSQDTSTINITTPALQYSSNQQHSIISMSSTRHNISNSVDYSHNFIKKGRTFYVGLSQSSQPQDQPSTIYSRVKTYDSAQNGLKDSIVHQNSFQNIKVTGYSFAAGYTEPSGTKHILDLSYRVNISPNRSTKTSLDYDSATTKFDISDSLTSNSFSSKIIVQQLSAGYSVVEGRLRYQLGLTKQLTNLINVNYSTGNNLRQTFSNFFPRLSLIYAIEKGKTFDLNYSGYSTSPTIEQLQPIPDFTNPFLIKQGNSHLQQQFDHTLSANYTSYAERNSGNFQAFLQGDYTEHKIATNSNLVAGGIQEIQYVNVTGAYSVTLNFTYGFAPGSNHKTNISLSANGQLTNDITDINTKEVITHSLSAGGRANLNYHPTLYLFIDAIASCNYSRASYSILKGQNTNSLRQGYLLDISYNFPHYIILSSNLNLQTITTMSEPGNKTQLWNTTLSKMLLRSHNIQLGLSAFNLLSKSTNFSQSISQTYIETDIAKIPTTLYLFSFVYHFKTFNN